MSLKLNAMELTGVKEHLKQYLNDPVNWVAFINHYDMSKEEQRHWRDHFGLEHTFEGELEA